MIQEGIALYTNNAKTVLPIVDGVVSIAGVRTPSNEIFTALVCWTTIGALWLFVNRSRAGKAVLAASMKPRGVTLLGIEPSTVYVGVWAIYGAHAGIAGVLLGMFLGASFYSAGPLAASAFSIVVFWGASAASQAADRRQSRGLSRDAHRRSRFAGLSRHPGTATAGHGYLCAPARIDGQALVVKIYSSA
jgi:branched-subunit amino acid ABC-type transport system permease component